MGLSNDLVNFLGDVKSFVNSCPMHLTWYRGHGQSRYELNSQIFRAPKASKNVDTVIRLEREIYKNFLRNAYPHIGPTAGFDALFQMQHHGTPTRLLDWSTSLGVALYFATDDWRQGRASQPHVWLLSPYALNVASFGQPSIVLPDNSEYEHFIAGNYRFSHSLAVVPRLMDARIVNQQGCFTIQGDSGLPLNQETFSSGCLSETTLKRIEIPVTMLDELEWFLSHIAGVSKHVLFPDLDGVSSDLKLLYQRLSDDYFV